MSIKNQRNPAYDHRIGAGHSLARASSVASHIARHLITAALLALFLSGPVYGQALGTLAPVPQQVFLDASGRPVANGKVYTYQAGTTTPLDTYCNAALTCLNANPITLNSAGRSTNGGIYLGAANYKFIVKSSALATIYTQDNIAGVPYTTTATQFNATCDVRLTLTTGTPVTTADVFAAAGLYVTPYLGNRCAFYDGSQWNMVFITELSRPIIPAVANTNFDVFIYRLTDGTPDIQYVQWTNDTTRAVPLSVVDGVLVKSSDTARRYVGTFRTTGVAGETEDSFAKRFVWNMNHRVRRGLRVLEATASWNYSTNTFRQARASTTNQVAVVVGVAETLLTLTVAGSAIDSAGVAAAAVSIGEDSTTTPIGGILMQAPTFDNTHRGTPSARVERFPAVGYHFYTWLEIVPVTGGTVTWDGTAGATYIQNGISGFIEG